ncbi:MAG: hypothetical protein KJ655_01925 [Candidatus Thermoplasmatota archaeon]|nr:hypothetical protein [Candidatus Thermoplasmatota archaeon]
MEDNTAKKQVVYNIAGIVKEYIEADIIGLADRCGLGSYIPGQLRHYGPSDFNLKSDTSLFFENVIEKEGTTLIENLFQLIYDSIKKYQCCRLHEKGICPKQKQKGLVYFDCENCADFVDNGIKTVLSQYFSTLGYTVNTKGLIISSEKGRVNIEDIVREVKTLPEKITQESIKEFLPDDIITKSKELASAYSLIYCVENSLRIYIIKEIENISLASVFSSDQKKKINRRKKDEEKNRWLSVRGGNSLFYLDISDLSDIIKNNWKLFKEDFPNQEWITAKIHEISGYRNLIAHNSYIKKDDQLMLSKYYEQILKQIATPRKKRKTEK